MSAPHGGICHAGTSDSTQQVIDPRDAPIRGRVDLYMCDAFKHFSGGKGKLVQKQTDELETLIATAREERGAISAMLTRAHDAQREAHTARPNRSSRSPRRRPASTARLDEIAKRLTALDERTRELEESTSGSSR